MIRPTPAVSAWRSSASLLLLPCRPTRREVDPGPLDHGQLAAGADVDAQPLLAHPAGDRGAEEGLGRVVDVPAGEGRRRRRGPGRAGPPRPARTPACRPGRRSRSTLIPATVSTPSASLLTLAAPQRGQQRVDVVGHRQPAGRAGSDVGVDRAGDVGCGSRADCARRAPTARRFSRCGHGGRVAPARTVADTVTWSTSASRRARGSVTGWPSAVTVTLPQAAPRQRASNRTPHSVKNWPRVIASMSRPSSQTWLVVSWVCTARLLSARPVHADVRRDRRPPTRRPRCSWPRCGSRRCCSAARPSARPPRCRRPRRAGRPTAAGCPG